MRKLRLFRERKEQHGEHAELRGLNDSELFQKAGFFARLAISGVAPEDLHLQEVMKKYQLAEHAHGEHVTLHSRTEMPGSHKLHAMTLFFAALEIHRAHSNAKLFLYQHDGLSTLLAERVQQANTAHHHQETALLETWKKNTAPLTLHGPISHHLWQANVLSVHHTTELHTMGASDLEGVHQHLTHEATAHSNHHLQRKVA